MQSANSTITNASRGRAPNWSHPLLNSPDEDDDRRRRYEGPPVTQLPATGAILSKNLTFACPYMKFDEARYSNEDCCGLTGYDTISRLKEHLYRKHRICDCCRTNFADEDLLQKNLANGCIGNSREPHRPSDGLVASQAYRIKKRWTNQKPAEKWAKVYRILFEIPENHIAPSPYFQTRDELQREHNRRGEAIAKLLNQVEQLQRDNERLRRHQSALAWR